MKRIILAIAAVAALASCATTSTPEDQSGPSDKDAWYTAIDPATDRQFRCFDRWRTEPYKGGLSTFCYEVER